MKIISEKTKQLSFLIASFFSQNPAISVNFIEKKLSIPIGTINRAINADAAIPEKHIFPIFCELAQYGLTYDGYTLSVDENKTLFGVKLSDDPAESYEVRTYKDGRVEEVDITNYDYSKEEDVSDHFTSSFFYKQKVYRTMWTDYHDL